MSAKLDKVFVDTGAWIALAVTTDPYHVRARSVWADLVAAGRKRLVEPERAPLENRHAPAT